jgi:hypothetical protein
VGAEVNIAKANVANRRSGDEDVPDSPTITYTEKYTVFPMNLEARRQRYQAIEDYRKRPLIVYATSTRPGVPGQMSGDTVREFVDQIDAISADSSSIDILVHSTGGDALAAWKIMSLLRERFVKVGVLVPFMAFSAATLFALGADEIVMHPHASLGPIDPQIGLVQPDGSIRQFAYEDVGAFLRFLGTEVKITEQAHISAVIEKLFSVVDPVNVGAAKRASELSSSIGERLLLTHMTGEDRTRARQIAENLNKSFFAHGDAVSRRRARELHLKIAKEDREMENLIWQAYLGIEDYFQMRLPFNPLQHYMSDPAGAAALAPVPPVSLPPNAPPQLAQQVWQAVLQQAATALTGAAVEVAYSVVNAVLESTRVASEFRTEGKLAAFRGANGEVQLAGADTSSRWKIVQQGPSNAEEGAVQTQVQISDALVAQATVPAAQHPTVKLPPKTGHA